MEYLNIRKTVYSVSDFLSWYRQGTLVLNPHFQRRPVWKVGAKSFLIDTITRGLPIPVIILREQKADLESLEPKREVVDGQQRMRTIIAFIKSSLLKDFEAARDSFLVQKIHNAELAGKGFEELDPDLCQRILDYQFSVHILPASVGDSEIYEIFSRMNSTGYRLNHQELRNARYYGEFKTFVYDLSSEQLRRWRLWGIFNETELSRMEEAQMISEFAIMLLRRAIVGRSQLMITRYYRMFDKAFPEKDSILDKIRRTFDVLEDLLGESLKDLIFRRKTLFYALFAAIHETHFGLSKSKSAPSKISKRRLTKLLEVNRDFVAGKVPRHALDASQRRTTSLESRRSVFNYVRSHI